MITRLRLDLSHLRNHKFKESFEGYLKPTYNCDTVTTTYMKKTPL